MEDSRAPRGGGADMNSRARLSRLARDRSPIPARLIFKLSRQSHRVRDIRQGMEDEAKKKRERVHQVLREIFGEKLDADEVEEIAQKAMRPTPARHEPRKDD